MKQESQSQTEKQTIITSVYLTNKISATLIIPVAIARRKGLDHPSKVSVEEVPEGILIRKLEIDWIKDWIDRLNFIIEIKGPLAIGATSKQTGIRQTQPSTLVQVKSEIPWLLIINQKLLTFPIWNMAKIKTEFGK
jgi:hypothetical protein